MTTDTFASLAAEIDGFIREVGFENDRVRRHLRTALVCLADVIRVTRGLDPRPHSGALWDLRAKELDSLVAHIKD